ncbi:MAG: TGS domain-containing protein [Deltaproteobacteria bacterium]|nr:TGS domain-containing protein [Deltaproteobacteria bacterium]
MPANLPPQYFETEKRYREAKTPEGKIEALEEMLTIMPKHKGTDKLRADLRRKISKFKSQSQQKKSTSKRETAYSIEREGAAQIAVIGPPNVGKSSLIATLTNATPEVADFPHSTWSPSPGMVLFENIQFQLIDTPPITMGYIDPLMVDLIRRADILIILLDLHADPLQQLESTLSILQGLRIFPDGVSIPEGLKKLPFIKKVFVVLNKMDETEDEEDYEIFLELSETKLPTLGISVLSERNLTILIEKIYDMSDIIRVYTKSPGKEEDFNVPFVLPKESTLEELAVKIHKDFTNKLKFAKIWGKAVFDGQMVQRDYILQDGDVVEIHI